MSREGTNVNNRKRRRDDEAPADDIKKKRQPSHQGEHVINKDVLTVYRKILNVFMQKVLGINLEDMRTRFRLDSKVKKACDQPLPKEIEDLIRNQMVVDVSGLYSDENSQPYGESIEQLRDTAVKYMEHIFNGTQERDMSEVKNDLLEAVNGMIDNERFVDQAAK